MKYILNLTQTVLSISKYLDIPAGKFASIADHEVESPEVIYAVRAKWATIHDEIPKEITFETPEIVFETPASEGNFLPDAVEQVVAEPVAQEAEEAPVEAEKPKAPRGKAK